MRKYLEKIFDCLNGKIDYFNSADLIFNTPQFAAQGDISTNIALMLKNKLNKNPRLIAQEIISCLEYDSSCISKVEIAGPGFINFFFTEEFHSRIIKEILSKRESFGQSDKYRGKKAIVEFVSANPTGPLTVGHGRNAVIGDTVANMLEFIGYSVSREYYFNNAGRQMRVLGDSVRLRYLELLGETIEFPEDHYQGEYIKDIAAGLIKEYSDGLRQEPAEGIFKERAEEVIFADIKGSLGKINVIHDSFYNENELYEKGRIKEVISRLKEKGLTYEQEGALWLKLTDLGGSQDKVIVKSTGEPTYRLPDVAYHITKFERGYDFIVDLFGSDHMATYPDVMAALSALGYDESRVKVLIHQFVTIMQNGDIVKMSTRKANFITLDELTEEVGADVVRYFFNMRSMSSHLTFDIDLAKKQSDENPVFYLQYAHARIASIMNLAEEQSLEPSLEHLELLREPEEQKLLKKLDSFEYEMISASEAMEVHKIATYLEELASMFHSFYTKCRIIGSSKEIAQARLALAIAVQIVLKNGLGILGVSAPEKM